MDLLKEQYKSDDSDSESELEKEEEVQGLPEEILVKFNIPPSVQISDPANMTPLGLSKRWSTFVSLEWRPNSYQRHLLQKRIKTFFENSTEPNKYDFQSQFMSSLGAPLPLHVSLTRSIHLNSEKQRMLLCKCLQRQLAHQGVIKLEFDNDLHYFSAVRRHGLFLAMKLSSKCQEQYMAPLMENIEKSMIAAKVPNYKTYLLPSETTHISIAMALGVPKEEVKRLIAQKKAPNKNKSRDPSITELNSSIAQVNAVSMTFNKQRVIIPLQPQVTRKSRD